MTTISGGPGNDLLNEVLGDGVTAVDGGGGVNTLTADWSATSDSIIAADAFSEGTHAGPATSGLISDTATGTALDYANIQNLNVIAGSGDDSFQFGSLTGATSIAGGGGQNALFLDFSGASDAITSTSTGPNSGVITDTATGQSLTYSQIQNLYFSGGSGNDLIVGTAGSDGLHAGSGNTTIVGGGGDDVITGGPNTTAVFSGNRVDYSISAPDQNGFVDIGGPDGFDILLGVGHLQFDDMTVTLNQSFDFSGSSDSFQVTLNTDTGSGSIQDLTTGVVTNFAGVNALNVTTGSGDDTFVVAGSGQTSFNFNGGGGQNHLSGDFPVDAILGLDTTPGSTSSLIVGTPPFNFSVNSLTNIQSVDVTAFGSSTSLTGGDGNDNLNAGFSVGAVVDGGAGNDTVTGGFEILGGPGDDVLTGTSQAVKYAPPVIMTGGAGNDTLYGDGVEGIGPVGGWQPADIATYSGNRASYSITTDAQGVSTVTDLRPGSPDGTDTLVNVAQLQFADGTFDLQNGPEVITSQPSNDLIVPGAGTAGALGATATVTLSDTVGTPFFADFINAPLTGPTQLGSPHGEYGDAILDPATGLVTYTLDTSNPHTQALQHGDVVTDSFFVGAADNRGFVAQGAVVTFTIDGPDNAPLPGADKASTPYATPVTLTAASLLANDNDPDGDALTLTAVGGAQHGTVSLNGGVVTFTPTAGYGEAGSFDYTVDDGHGGTATGHVAVRLTGTSAAYINHAGVTKAETIDTTGDPLSHNIVVGSGDDTVLTGAGGSSVKLGAGDDVVIGGSGKDTITFGPGLGTVTGGAGPDVFIFAKGQIADPAAHAGLYDTVTDFTGAGAYVPGRDFIYLKGFASSSTITYEHDLAGDPSAHLYRIDDGAYHAEFVLDYAGPGLALSHNQYGFI